MTTATTTKTTMLILRQHVFSFLCCLALLMDVTAAQRQRARRRRKGGGRHWMLAESVDMVQAVSGAASPKAGDYIVWDNFVWEYDEEENAPSFPTGSSRGSCVRLSDGSDGLGHCSWTVTVQHEEEDEEGIVVEEDKIMILGEVTSLAWRVPQVLAIVGGVGKYKGASGEVEVSFVPADNFYVYNFYLD